MFPNRVPLDTYFVSRANGLFVHSYCQSPQLRSPPTKTDKTFVHCPQSPTGTEGLHTVGCGLVLQPDCSQHCCHYSVPCSLQHDTFHLEVISSSGSDGGCRGSRRWRCNVGRSCFTARLHSCRTSHKLNTKFPF